MSTYDKANIVIIKVCPREPGIVAISPADKFCWHCGAALEAHEYPDACASCGGHLGRQDSFCPGCGLLNPAGPRAQVEGAKVPPPPAIDPMTTQGAASVADDCPF